MTNHLTHHSTKGQVQLIVSHDLNKLIITLNDSVIATIKLSDLTSILRKES